MLSHCLRSVTMDSTTGFRYFPHMFKNERVHSRSNWSTGRTCGTDHSSPSRDFCPKLKRFLYFFTVEYEGDQSRKQRLNVV